MPNNFRIKIHKLLIFFINYINFITKFILYNIISLIKNKLSFDSLPIFNQITLFNGKGMVEVGEKCLFGYKLGGFYKGGSIEIQARYQNSKNG